MASTTPPDSSEPQSTSASPRAGAAAFSASLTLHLAAFFLLAILFAAPAVDSEPEPVRAVGIVLTPPSSPVRFDDTVAATSPASPPAGVADTPAESLNRASSDALPFEAASAVRLPTLSHSGAVPTPIASAQELATGTRSGARLSGARIAGEGDDEQAIAEEQERLRPRLPTTASTQISLFGSAPATGRSFVFLIDRSKSMGANGLDAIDASQRELRQALSALREEHSFQVIAYNFKPIFVDQRTLLPATQDNKARADAFLSQFGGFGATEHDMAIHTALRLTPDVIFVLTDGGDPWLSDSQLAAIRQRAAGRTTIHCVQFGLGQIPQAHPFLRTLAEQNGGSYRYVDRSGK